MRLDRLIGHLGELGRPEVRRLLQAGRVRVDGMPQRDGTQQISRFEEVCLDQEILQTGQSRRYFMLHKPAGYVSANQHHEHPCVFDLIPGDQRDALHLAGRLDLGTTGLLLMTNDGGWSRRLTSPASKQPKVYLVEVEHPLDQRYVERFEQGLYFAYENLTTLPAQLELLGTHHARLTLHEGRYHQVKRMFGHFRNRVIHLHRERIGSLVLDDLPEGSHRPLTPQEIARF